MTDGKPDRHSIDTRRMLATPVRHPSGVPTPLNLPIEIRAAQSRRATSVVLYWEGRAFASGVAKRHPGDANDPTIGQAVALSRAFAMAAEEYARRVDAWTRPEPEPDGEIVKELRRANRAQARRRKDERRAAARERYARRVRSGT